MPTPHYIIHIGPMKTASTYLQKCIADAAPFLAANNIYFPHELSDPASPTVHTPIMSAIFKPEMYEPTKKIFDSLNASGRPTILLTTEHLAALRKPAILKLRGLIGTDNVTIVYMCRRWSDRITSLWFQDAFGGGIQSFPEYYVRLVNGEHNPADIDYRQVWERWTSIFGLERLKIVPISNIGDAKQDIFDRFCTDILGLPHAPSVPQTGQKAWASGDAKEVELVRALNALHQQHTGVKDTTMFWGSKAISRKHNLAPLMELMQASTRQFQLDDNAVYLAAAYKRLEAYAESLSSVRDGAQMFTRKTRLVDYISPDYLLRQNAAAQLQSLYAAIIASGIKAPRAA